MSLVEFSVTLEEKCLAMLSDDEFCVYLTNEFPSNLIGTMNLKTKVGGDYLPVVLEKVAVKRRVNNTNSSPRQNKVCLFSNARFKYENFNFFLNFLNSSILTSIEALAYEISSLAESI